MSTTILNAKEPNKFLETIETDKNTCSRIDDVLRMEITPEVIKSVDKRVGLPAQMLTSLLEKLDILFQTESETGSYSGKVLLKQLRTDMYRALLISAGMPLYKRRSCAVLIKLTNDVMVTTNNITYSGPPLKDGVSKISINNVGPIMRVCVDSMASAIELTSSLMAIIITLKGKIMSC